MKPDVTRVRNLLLADLEQALSQLCSWKADAEEYPSWAWQYREKAYQAIDTLERVAGDLRRERERETGLEPQ